jgi:DNA-binding response OmpR family regulator
MMQERVLIVEDELRLREILCDYFQAKGDLPTPAEDGEAALRLLDEQTFDAILLDVLMPGLDGFSVCRAIRQDSRVPVIFLTALCDDDDQLMGYELGADDYVTKPFSMAVLYAKTMAVIARSRGAVGQGGPLAAGNVVLDPARRTVTVDGQPVTMTPRSFALLQCLMEHKNQVLTREQLLRRVWGYDYEGDSRTVDTHVKRLRAKGIQVETVIRVGYRFRG